MMIFSITVCFTNKSNVPYLFSLSGMDLQFEWDEVEAFVRQPDGSLFSWCERFRCFNHLIYGIVSYSCCTTLFLNFEAVEVWLNNPSNTLK